MTRTPAPLPPLRRACTTCGRSFVPRSPSHRSCPAHNEPVECGECGYAFEPDFEAILEARAEARAERRGEP